MDVKLGVLVLIAIGLTYEANCLNLDRHARRRDEIGELKEGILGAIRKASPPLVRKDLRTERLKAKCNLCKIHDKCKRLGNCEDCAEPCEQYLQSLQTTTQLPTKFNNPTDMVAISQRTSSEAGLSDNEERYYTLGAFQPGAVQTLLRRLLGITEPEGRMVVMVQPETPKKQKKQPIIIDTAHVFTLNEGTPKKIDVEMHDVGKVNEDAGELVTKLNKNIDEALNSKSKDEEHRLTPEEVDRIIATTIDTDGMVMSARNTIPEDQSGTKKKSNPSMDTDGAFLTSENDVPVDLASENIAVNDNQNTESSTENGEKVGCSKEEEDDYYRSANEEESNPKHSEIDEIEDKAKPVDNHLNHQSLNLRNADTSTMPLETKDKDETPGDEEKGKPVENTLEEKSPMNLNGDIEMPKMYNSVAPSDKNPGDEDKGKPVNNNLENKQLQSDEPEVLFVENSPVPKPVSDSQYGISKPDARSAVSYQTQQQPIVQPESTYDVPQEIVYNQPEVYGSQQSYNPEYVSPSAQYAPTASGYSVENPQEQTYENQPQAVSQYSEQVVYHQPQASGVSESNNQGYASPSVPSVNYDSPQTIYQSPPAPSQGYSIETPQEQNYQPPAATQYQSPAEYEPKVEPIDIAPSPMNIVPGTYVNLNELKDKYLVGAQEAPSSLKGTTSDWKGLDEGRREDGRGTMHAPKIQMMKTTIDKVISTPNKDQPEVTIHDGSEIAPQETSSLQQREPANIESHREAGRGAMHAPKIQPKKTTIEQVISSPTIEEQATSDHLEEQDVSRFSQRDTEISEVQIKDGRANTPKAPKVQPKRTDIQSVTTTTIEKNPRLPSLVHKAEQREESIHPSGEIIKELKAESVPTLKPDGLVGSTQETVGNPNSNTDEKSSDESYTRKIDPPKIQNMRNTVIDKVIITPHSGDQQEVPAETLKSLLNPVTGHWRSMEHPTLPENPTPSEQQHILQKSIKPDGMLGISQDEGRSDTIDRNNKPVLPLFIPMSPKGVSVTPEQEMNLRQEPPSMDDTQIANAVSGIVDDATLSATHINKQLMDIVNEKISNTKDNLVQISSGADGTSMFPAIAEGMPARLPTGAVPHSANVEEEMNVKEENPSMEEDIQKETLLVPQTNEDTPDQTLRQSENNEESENPDDEEVGCKKEKKVKYYMKMKPMLPMAYGNGYGNDEYRSANEAEDLTPSFPALSTLPPLPTLQDLLTPRSHHEPMKPNHNNPHRPQNHHNNPNREQNHHNNHQQTQTHHNRRPNHSDRQQKEHFIPRQFEQDDNQMISLPQVANDYRRYHHLGRIVPWDHSVQKRDLAEQIRKRNMFFNGDGINLPLSLKEYKDGSLHLSIDVKSLCNCKHCNGEHSHDISEFSESTVGVAPKIERVYFEMPPPAKEKVKHDPNQSKEIVETADSPQMQEEESKLRKRSIRDNRIEKSRVQNDDAMVLPIQKFNRNNLFNADSIMETNIIGKETTMSPEKFNLLKSFLDLMKNLVTNDIDIS